MKTELLSCPEQLKRYVPAWDRLSANALEKNAFYSSWMLLPALKNFSNEAVKVLLIWDSGQLIGLFPLCLRQPLPHIPFRCHGMWKYKHCYLCTPLIDRAKSRKCLNEFRVWLRAHSYIHAAMEIESFAANEAFADQLFKALAEDRTQYLERNSYYRGLLRCNIDSATYLHNNRNSRTIKSALQKMRKLERDGKVDFKILTKGDCFKSWIEDFLNLEQAGWKGRSGTALKSSRQSESFFREVTCNAAQRGSLLATRLYFRNVLISTMCIFSSDTAGFAFKTTFDENYGSYSPGLLLAFKTTQYLLDHSAIETVDSCSLPGDMFFKIWRDKRPIRTLLINDRYLKSVSLIFWLLTRKKSDKIRIYHKEEPAFGSA